jgi:amidohydrolase
VREDLHRHPELGLEEERTASVVARALREAGVDEVRTEVAGTGVVGLLRGAQQGGTVALRADMDALPIQEETGLPYASVNAGVMHACGHDGHTAALLAASEVLAGMRGDVAGTVKLIFQPGEEGFGGALKMVRAGCLRDPDVDAIFALHALNGIGAGRVLLSLTPTVAACLFEVAVEGRGGHGAMPQACVDPVVAAAQIVTAAQTIVSREVRPDQPAVLTFGSIQAGTKSNIIPDSARILGTVRAMEMGVLTQVRGALARVAQGVGAAMRVKVNVEDSDLYPPVKNDPALLELIRGVAAEVLGPDSMVSPREQLMGAEDFAYYLPEQGGVPGALFFLGVETDANLHSSRFDFGSAGLEPGILMLANTALRFLGKG